MTRTVRRISFTVAAVIVILLFHAWFFLSPSAARLDYALLDFWFGLRGPIPARDDVVIVSMDEASYRNLAIPYTQAWPRKLHARLVHKLAAAGAKKVIFDVLFLDPSAELGTDEALARAFAEMPTVIGADQGLQQTSYGSYEEILLPYALFRQRAEAAFTALPEEMGRVRHFYLSQYSRSDPNVGENKSVERQVVNLRPLAFAAADFSPTAEGPRTDDLINFYGPAGHLPSFSYYQILEDSVPFPPERLRGKIVFVGLKLRSEIGPEQKDSFLTSFDENGRHYGVEIHATAAANLLSRDWIRRLTPARELFVLTLLLAVIAFACMLLSPMRAAYLSLFSGSFWLVVSFVCFKRQLFLPALSVLLVFAPAVYVCSTLLSYFVARQGQRKLRNALQLYLSPHMVARVTRDPNALGLGGRKVFATAVFTDIAGFTQICEAMQAEEVTQMLNDYFTEIVDAIFASQGTLIKFIGDAVFAIWGAPVALERHGEAALNASIAMRHKLLNSTVLKKYPPLDTRIGIHSGEMVVGNLGSRKRFDFTAIGDAVNLASRVEGLNKYLGTSILITDTVAASLSKSYPLLQMGKARVVGKSTAVALYTVLDEIPSEIANHWTSALANFAGRNWDPALDSLRYCSQHCAGLASAAEFYIKQINDHRLVPPADDWLGEVVISAK